MFIDTVVLLCIDLHRSCRADLALHWEDSDIAVQEMFSNV